MSWRPSADLKVIHERARIYRQIRSFFVTRGCLEVDTPLLMPATNTDVHIESIEVRTGGRSLYLQTSPEFAMKRLLAAGCGSIYQITHAFRQAEQGRRHHPEFSMLEWYRVGYDYRLLMDEMELLITTLSLRRCEFTRITYKQLFSESLDIDIDGISLPDLRAECQRLASDCDASALDFDQCLDLLLGMVIAPAMRGYQFVYDYPLSQASLARVSARDGSVAERFELFYDGIELANGFSELTDAQLQRARFDKDNRRREQQGLSRQVVDTQLLAALEHGLDDCAGVALGLDRLLMVLLERDSIDQVLTFRD